jgi:hypothetical protein
MYRPLKKGARYISCLVLVLVSPKKEWVWLPGSSSLHRSIQVCLRRLWCRALQCRISRSGIVFLIDLPLFCLLQRFAYCLSSMGWPQHMIVPVPPLVIIISAPHLVQRYLLPTVLAIFITSLRDFSYINYRTEVRMLSKLGITKED